MISPFGGSAKRTASSAALPRTTSSKRFVNSRHTATSRAGSKAASERSDAGRRFGDSKATTGQVQPAVSRHSASSSPRLARQEPDERVPPAGEPAPDERRLDRRRARQHRQLQPGVERRAHEPGAGVGDARHPGVRDERDALARLEPRDELGDPRRLVVLVVREQPRLDPVPLEQAAGVTRVLGEHDVGVAKLGEHAQGDVVEIPDRRRADGEGHWSAP